MRRDRRKLNLDLRCSSKRRNINSGQIILSGAHLRVLRKIGGPRQAPVVRIPCRGSPVPHALRQRQRPTRAAHATKELQGTKRLGHKEKFQSQGRIGKKVGSWNSKKRSADEAPSLLGQRKQYCVGAPARFGRRDVTWISRRGLVGLALRS